MDPNTISVKKVGAFDVTPIVLIVIATFYFAWKGYDQGHWEGLIYLLAIPVYFILGLWCLIRSIILRRANGKWTVLSLILMIVSITYVTVIPAMLITTQLESLVHLKNVIHRKEANREEQKENIERLTRDFKFIVGSYLAIQDVENDRILVKNDKGYFVLQVTNANKTGLLSNPQIYINKTVLLSIDADKAKFSDRVFDATCSHESLILLKRNMTESDLAAAKNFKPRMGADMPAVTENNLCWYGIANTADSSLDFEQDQAVVLSD